MGVGHWRLKSGLSRRRKYGYDALNGENRDQISFVDAGARLIHRGAKLEETKHLAKNEAKPSRSFKVEAPDVRALREEIGLTQSEFARLMQVSIKTLQNWEQHRRSPTEPAAALLKIVSFAPDVAIKTLNG